MALRTLEREKRWKRGVVLPSAFNKQAEAVEEAGGKGNMWAPLSFSYIYIPNTTRLAMFSVIQNNSCPTVGVED